MVVDQSQCLLADIRKLAKSADSVKKTAVGSKLQSDNREQLKLKLRLNLQPAAKVAVNKPTHCQLKLQPAVKVTVKVAAK